jgi:hypothetical protein
VCDIEWFALTPRHYRNPEGLPVPAVRLVGDEAERTQLIKQRRLVPDSWDESNRYYLQPAKAPADVCTAPTTT